MIFNTVSLNPFSLLMEPEIVLQAMERSQTLRSLRRQTFRPLDKPLIPYANIRPFGTDAEMEIDDEELEFELND